MNTKGWDMKCVDFRMCAPQRRRFSFLYADRQNTAKNTLLSAPIHSLKDFLYASLDSLDKAWPTLDI